MTYKKRSTRKRSYDLDPKDDGVTHINIYSQGKTDLGKALSNFSHHPLCHPEHGLFASVEGYWYWLTRQDEDLRHLYGFKAKELGRSLPVVKQWHPEQFKQYVCQAIDAKLQKHPSIMAQLKASTLPLEHYYAKYYGDKLKVTEPRGGEWVLAHFEKIRAEHNPEADMSTTQRMEEQEIAKQKRLEDSGEQLGLL